MVAPGQVSMRHRRGKDAPVNYSHLEKKTILKHKLASPSSPLSKAMCGPVWMLLRADREKTCLRRTFLGPGH